MSIIRITEGENRTEIEGGWTVYTDEFEAYAGKFSHFTSQKETLIGNPETAPQEVPDNAYVPVVTIYEDLDSWFKVLTIENTWPLSDHITEALGIPM